MADKYISLQGGRLKEREALVTSTGAGDSGKVVALDSSGRIDQSMMPVGVGPDTATIVASEALAAGDTVDVWNDAGTPKVRKADATAEGKEADGFVLAGVTLGNNALVYFEGVITGLSALTPGATYYLSAVSPGALVLTPPSGAGKVVQQVGVAISATEFSFEPSQPITLA